MSHQLQNLEDFFRDSYDGYAELPSENVLRNLKRKLWISDFFSTRMGKFNIVYFLLLICSIGSVVFFNSSKSHTTENQLSSANQPTLAITPTTKNDQPVFSSNNNKLYVSDKAASSAMFEVSEIKGCAPLNVKFKNSSVLSTSNDVKWDFGTGEKSSARNPEYNFKNPGKYTVTLTIHNKDKEYTYSQTIEVFDKPVANFEIDVANSEIHNRKVIFRNKSTGGSNYRWNFGDLVTSTEKEANHIYLNYKTYPVTLISTSDKGCSDTATLFNNFLAEDYDLVFPQNFRPNTIDKSNNGYYENASNEPFVFYPKNNGVEKYQLTVFAPNGTKIFSSDNIKQGWNGFIRGKIAPAGNYLFTAKGSYPNGKAFDLKGTVNVIVEDYQMSY